MGLFELFELCAEAAQPPVGEDSSRAGSPRGFEAEDFRLLKAQLFWPAMVSGVLACLALLEGFAAS